MAKKVKKSKVKKSKGSNQILLIFGVLMAVVMFASTVLLLIGMLPTFAALFADRTRRKSKAITIGAMNMASCSPFLFQLWAHGNGLGYAMGLITDFWPVVIMYLGAVVGYLINWSVSGVISSLLFQKGQARQKTIIKTQKELVKRWGPEVTGKLALDSRGFAFDVPDEENVGEKSDDKTDG